MRFFRVRGRVKGVSVPVRVLARDVLEVAAVARDTRQAHARPELHVGTWGATVRGTHGTPEAGTCPAQVQWCPPGASCPAPQVRAERRRPARVPCAYGTAAALYGYQYVSTRGGTLAIELGAHPRAPLARRLVRIRATATARVGARARARVRARVRVRVRVRVPPRVDMY